MKDAKQARSSQGARQSSWLAGLAALTITPLASALGLGQATVNSYYEQPLDVRIDLISRSEAEMATVTAGLASPSDFQIMGLTRSALGTPLEFTINRDLADPHIRVTSRQPMKDPVVQLVLEVVWSSGRMLRQYTVFLDPPTFDAPAPLPAPRRAGASEPVVASAPEPSATTSPFREEAPAPLAATPAVPVPDAEPLTAPPAQEAEPGETVVDRGPPFAPTPELDEPEADLAAPTAEAPAAPTIADAVGAALAAETEGGTGGDALAALPEPVVPKVPVTEPEPAAEDGLETPPRELAAEEALPEAGAMVDEAETLQEAAEDAREVDPDALAESVIETAASEASALADGAGESAAEAAVAAAGVMAQTDEVPAPIDAETVSEEMTEALGEAVPEVPASTGDVLSAAPEVLPGEAETARADALAAEVSDAVAAQEELARAFDEAPASTEAAEIPDTAVAVDDVSESEPASEPEPELESAPAPEPEPESEPAPEPALEPADVLATDSAEALVEQASGADGESDPAAADAGAAEDGRYKALLPSASGAQIEVQRGDTAWGLSRSIAAANDVSINQVMLALQQSNPQAFRDDNINRLLAGSILRVPERDQMVRLSAREAMLEAQRQEDIYRSRFTAPTAAEDLPRIANPERASEGSDPLDGQALPALEDDPLPETVVADPASDSADEVEAVASASLLELVPPSESGDGSRQEFGQGSDGDTGLSSASADGDLARTQEDLANAEQERSYLAERIEELETELSRRDAQPEEGVRDTTLAEMEQRLEAERLAGEETPPIQVRAEDEPEHWLSRFGAWLAGAVALLVLGLVAFLRSRRDPEIMGETVAPPPASESEAPAEATGHDPDSDAEDMPAEPSPETLRALAASAPPPPAPEPSTLPPGAEAIALSGDDPETLLDLARAYMSMGREADVRSLLDEVFRIGTPEQVEEARAMLREL